MSLRLKILEAIGHLSKLRFNKRACPIPRPTAGMANFGPKGTISIGLQRPSWLTRSARPGARSETACHDHATTPAERRHGL